MSIQPTAPPQPPQPWLGQIGDWLRDNAIAVGALANPVIIAPILGRGAKVVVHIEPDTQTPEDPHQVVS